MRVERRRRVAQRAIRYRVVLRVRLRRHAGGGGPVALGAAVRPAAELRIPGVRRVRRAALPVVVADVDPAGPERAAGRRHRNRRWRRVREGPSERHRPVPVGAHRRRRVAVAAHRPGARRARQVRPVRVAHQRVRQSRCGTPCSCSPRRRAPCSRCTATPPGRSARHCGKR